MRKNELGLPSIPTTTKPSSYFIATRPTENIIKVKIERIWKYYRILCQRPYDPQEFGKTYYRYQLNSSRPRPIAPEIRVSAGTHTRRKVYHLLEATESLMTPKIPDTKYTKLQPSSKLPLPRRTPTATKGLPTHQNGHDRPC